LVPEILKKMAVIDMARKKREDEEAIRQDEWVGDIEEDTEERERRDRWEREDTQLRLAEDKELGIGTSDD
jgi:hypothetical protein